MMVVGVIGQKGGGGKTTTSLRLAVAAAERGKAAVVLDLDQQANAAKWRDRRESDNVMVIGTLQSRIRQTIETARTHGAEYVVIDAPGHNDSAAVETVRAADIVLVPVEPQMFHFETLPAMSDLITLGGGKPTWILINKLHLKASIQAERLKRVLADRYTMAVCPVHLSRLDVYGTSADLGQTPIDSISDGKAAEEIRALYEFTCNQINQVSEKHVKKDAKPGKNVKG